MSLTGTKLSQWQGAFPIRLVLWADEGKCELRVGAQYSTLVGQAHCTWWVSVRGAYEQISDMSDSDKAIRS